MKTVYTWIFRPLIVTLLVLVVGAVVFGHVFPDEILLFTIGRSQVCVQSANPWAHAICLTQQSKWTGPASWWPNGQSIIYSTDGTLWKRTLWEGATATKILTGCNGSFLVHPVVSPNGKSVVYESWTSNAQSSICVTDDNGARFVGLGSLPNWSPDGKRLAYIHSGWNFTDGWIALVDADGKNNRQLFFGLFGMPHWSPDGKQILVPMLIKDTVEIVVIDPENGSSRFLTHDGGINTLAMWSPDGTKIAYVRHREGEEFFISLMNADGTDKRQLSTLPVDAVQAPAWSPDGKTIAFLADKSIYTVDITSGVVTRLTKQGEYEGISFQPKQQ